MEKIGGEVLIPPKPKGIGYPQHIIMKTKLEEVNIDTVRRNKGFKFWILQNRYEWLEKQRKQDRKESHSLYLRKFAFKFKKYILFRKSIYIDIDFGLIYYHFINSNEELDEKLYGRYS